MRAYRNVAGFLLISANLLLLSCSGDGAPKPGTSAFYWAAAQQTYAAGDYQKTEENLANVLSTENEFAARARPWMLVLTSGMAQGYMDLAEAYDAGAHANRAQVTNFRKLVSTYRGNANTLALQFAEALSKFDNKEEYVTLAFAYPTGSPTEVLLLNKVSAGTWLTEADTEAARKRAIERAVLLSTCRAAGAKNDPAKALDLLKTKDAKVPRATFVQAMAASLFEDSQLYVRNKLDQPDKLKIFCSRAQDTLKLVPTTKEAEELDKKIQSTLKKAKA